MTVYGSDSVGFFLIGGFDLRGAITELDGPWISAATEESQGLGASWPEPLAVGVRTVELKQAGFFNDAQHSVHEALKDAQGVHRAFAVNLTGNVVGRLLDFGAGACAVKYHRISSRGALHKAQAEYRVSGELYQDGVLLLPWSEQTADWDTEASAHDHGAAAAAVTIVSSSIADPTVITTDGPHGYQTGDTVRIAGHTSVTPDINGEHVVTVLTPTTFSIPVEVTDDGVDGTVTRISTRDGAAVLLQVGALDLDGHTNLTVKVRDSADNVTFGDLVTFTAVTAGHVAEVKTVTGPVEQFTAVDGDFTGAGTTPTAQVLVALKRLEDVE